MSVVVSYMRCAARAESMQHHEYRIPEAILQLDTSAELTELVVRVHAAASHATCIATRDASAVL